ncbi:hypothetical protein DFH11DRAFT_1543321 [Phellopilus nigrolimitatus]|nr:hypothetical protein DFH11DRAFT_1543321 [Phellopilus nigrolimitatus]
MAGKDKQNGCGQLSDSKLRNPNTVMDENRSKATQTNAALSVDITEREVRQRCCGLAGFGCRSEVILRKGYKVPQNGSGIGSKRPAQPEIVIAKHDGPIVVATRTHAGRVKQKALPFHSRLKDTQQNDSEEARAHSRSAGQGAEGEIWVQPASENGQKEEDNEYNTGGDPEFYPYGSFVPKLKRTKLCLNTAGKSERRWGKNPQASRPLSSNTFYTRVPTLLKSAKYREKNSLISFEPARAQINEYTVRRRAAHTGITGLAYNRKRVHRLLRTRSHRNNGPGLVPSGHLEEDTTSSVFPKRAGFCSSGPVSSKTIKERDESHSNNQQNREGEGGHGCEEREPKSIDGEC